MLPDAKTVIGVDYSDKYKLMIEDITQGNPRQIGTHRSWISTVLFDSLTQSLLVGDNKGHVKQYKKLNQSFTMVKDYGDVGLNSVLSSTIVGGFAVFGGDFYSLVAIDISEQRFCARLPKSPYLFTYSLQVCEGVGSDVFLSLGGTSPEYSSDATDFLDVTLLYKGQKKDSAKLFEEMNQADALLEKKDLLIKSLNLKIEKLKSFLQKQADNIKSKSNSKISKNKTSP